MFNCNTLKMHGKFYTAAYNMGAIAYEKFQAAFDAYQNLKSKDL